HAKQRGLTRAKRKREVWRQTVIDTEAPRVFADQRHADVLGEAHCHDIARLLDAEPQRRRTVVFLGVVFRGPDAGAGIDLDWRIEDDGRRRIAVVEGGGVDERLERGSRLAQRLRGAIKLALVIGEAAGHRQNPPGLRIHRDDGARDFRYLTQAELPVPAGKRLDIDDVAWREHLQYLGRRLAAHRSARRPGPLCALQHSRAGLALLRERAARLAGGLQADAGGCIVGLQHDREAPQRYVGERLDVGERDSPIARRIYFLDGAAIALLLVEIDETVDQ